MKYQYIMDAYNLKHLQRPAQGSTFTMGINVIPGDNRIL